MTFKVGPKPVGLAARKAAAKSDALATTEPTMDFKKMNPQEMPDRIGIVFDDSGSMSGYASGSFGWNDTNGESTKIKDAHAGVEEFLRSCKPGKTAVAIYPMNARPMALSCDLIALAMQIKAIEPDGGTPLLPTLDKMLDENKLTRAIAFSDGMADDTQLELIVAKCLNLKVPVDTVYIGNANSTAPIEFMKRLAEMTGGVFLLFDPAKMNFRTAFKYLSPGYYGLLADKSFVTDLQEGKKN